jgi:hypothetical protein
MVASTAMKRRGIAVAATACAAWLALLSGGATVAFASPTQATVAPGESAADDTYRQVEKLLHAGISEEVVGSWLASRPAPPLPTAEELVALKTAGASDALLARIVDLAGRAPRPAAKPAPAAAAPAAPGASAAPEGAAAASAPAAPAAIAPLGAPPAPPPPPAPADGRVEVRFALSYQPRFDVDEEPWDLFVYLDGEPLALVPRIKLFGRDEPLHLTRRLAPGHHVLRLAQERHRQDRHGWTHQARASKRAFELDLASGLPADVELAFVQPLLSLGDAGPVHFKTVQGDRTAEVDRTGGDPEAWPLLCEEIEANLAPGEKPGRLARRQLAGCVRWGDLWPGGAAPSREAVRAALQAADFAPGAGGR